MNKRKIFLLICVLATFIPALSGCEKYALDRHMEELCEKDGGSKVYEVVKLPENMLTPSGKPFSSVEKNTGEGRLGDEYIYSNEIEILKDGNIMKGEGRLLRGHIKIFRKSDSKLLGESITYGRSGGDGIVLGHPSSSTCPKSGVKIENQIFIKE